MKRINSIFYQNSHIYSIFPSNLNDQELQNEIGNLEEYTNKKLMEISGYIKENCYNNGVYSMNEEVDIVFVEKKLS
ncbi:MAG: hypothetical protein ABIA04_10745 [Pseudomonadota bacterium]